MVTVEDLAKAIRNSIEGSRDLAEEEAYMLAHHVLNFFGYADRIIDNVLEPEDRDAFYMLEDAGILTTEREETTLYDGREWRIHYWLFKRDRIATLMNQVRKGDDESDQDLSIYDQLSDDVWVRGGQAS
ncbi:MAG: hypothetical protein IJ856_00100 [Candidatus Methanomethylophilaceae archaeon]|nr:hypothetical protein [Candidatus Methanomethylophilaceae archaeon]